MTRTPLNEEALKTFTEIERVIHKAGYNCTCVSTPDNVTVDKDWLDVKLAILKGRLLLISEESTSSKVEEFINQRPGYVTALRNTRGTDDQTDYWRWNGHAEARRQLADSLGWTVPYHQGETTQQEVDDD